MLRKIADSTVSLLVLAASRAVFLLLVANLFGPLALGVVSVSTSTMMLFAVVLASGSAALATRWTAKEPALAPRLRADALAFGLAALVIGLVVTFFLLHWFGDSVFRQFDRLARGTLPFLIASQVVLIHLHGIHQGLGRFSLLSWSHAVHLGTLALATIGTLALGLDVGALLAAYVLASLTRACFLALSIEAPAAPYPLAERLRSVARQTRAGSHMMLGWLANLLNYRLDMLMLAYFVPTEQVGFYAAAVAVAEITLYLPRGIAQVALPWASATAHRIEWHQVRRVLWIQATTAALLAVLTALAAPALLPLVFGPSFTAAVAPARVLLLAAVFGGLGLLTMSLLYGLEHARLNTRASGIAVLVNVAANLVLIPRFGILGAAYGSCASYLIYFAATTLALRHVTSQPLRPQVEKSPT